MSQTALRKISEPVAGAKPVEILGHIVSVTGPRAVALLSQSVHLTERSERQRVQIGAFVKIRTPRCSVLGLVTGMSTPLPMMMEQEDRGVELVELNLVGEIAPKEPGQPAVFRRGVANPPSIGDPLVTTDREDLTGVFSPPALTTVKVGSLYQDSTVDARLLVDELLSKHFAITGSTGSGKSCALTCILRRILEEHRHAHVVVLDMHNEYKTAFGDSVEAINLGNFSLPFWLLNFQELCAALTTSDQHRDAETEILSEGVVFARRRYTEVGGRTALLRRPSEITGMTVETPTPFRLSDVIAHIDEQLGKLERVQLTLPYRRLKSRIEMMIADQRYSFMFGSLTVQDTMSETLGRLFRVPGEGRPISVLDLSVVPVEILDVVVSVISRLAFDVGVWSKGRVPILLVCEEAHRYVPCTENAQFAPTRQALGRIAKEGRKYGISLALVTQRPSELDPTILSQCSTTIALRLSNERDQQVMRASSHEGIVDLMEFLPMLGDREAIILGQGVSMPMRILFDDLNRDTIPRNLNASFSRSWKSPGMDRHELEAIVSRWRQAGRDRTEAPAA